MDIKIITDKDCGYTAKEASEQLMMYCKQNNIRAKKHILIVVFTNNWNFIKEVKTRFQEKSVLINVTENLSEQHIINTLKFAEDICYLKNDVNVIATRIIKAYNNCCFRHKKG